VRTDEYSLTEPGLSSGEAKDLRKKFKDAVPVHICTPAIEDHLEQPTSIVFSITQKPIFEGVCVIVLDDLLEDINCLDALIMDIYVFVDNSFQEDLVVMMGYYLSILSAGVS
jgi:hypothetical protein